MSVTRWGSNAPRDPAMARESNVVPILAPDDRGAPPGREAASPVEKAGAGHTLESIRAWFAQREAMRAELEEQLSAARGRAAELELLVLELDAMGGIKAIKE